MYAEDAPRVDPDIFELGIPVLGFCYGHQITAVTLGGKVAHSEMGEYGPATIAARPTTPPCFDCHARRKQTVWMSHRDAVSDVPGGLYRHRRAPTCAPWPPMENAEREIYTTQFHPEVKHTEYGQQHARATSCSGICGLETELDAWTTSWRP